MKEKIESAAKEVREALKGTDVAAIKTASEKLNEHWQAASAEMYKAASAESAKARSGAGQAESKAGPAPEAGAAKEEGPIIDAEVVDEKK
jgi:molecular chaperone DnaK